MGAKDLSNSVIAGSPRNTLRDSYCKYLSGEVVTSVAFGQAADIWEFSVDDRSSSNPLVKQLEDAERTGARVTLRYRQDLHSLYRCTPSEYFVTEVLP